MTELADKIRARDYVARTVGEQHLIPAYATMDHLSEEAYERLPDSFVLKANHGCKMNLLVRNKASLDYAEAR